MLKEVVLKLIEEGYNLAGKIDSNKFKPLIGPLFLLLGGGTFFLAYRLRHPSRKLPEEAAKNTMKEADQRNLNLYNLYNTELGVGKFDVRKIIEYSPYESLIKLEKPGLTKDQINGKNT